MNASETRTADRQDVRELDSGARNIRSIGVFGRLAPDATSTRQSRRAVAADRHPPARMPAAPRTPR